MSNESTNHVLCQLQDIPDPGSKGISKIINGMNYELFVVRRGDIVRAYVNSCPHTGGPLDWMPDTFLDEDNRHIICSLHGAVFQIEDGFCLAGPCAGQSLSPLRTEIIDGTVYLAQADGCVFS